MPPADPRPDAPADADGRQRLTILFTDLSDSTHLSTVMEAHEILVMDGGRIVERGTHGELLAADGRYASMWRLQQNQAPELPEALAPA